MEADPGFSRFWGCHETPGRPSERPKHGGRGFFFREVLDSGLRIGVAFGSLR